MSLEEGMRRRDEGLDRVKANNSAFYAALRQFFVYEWFPKLAVGAQFTVNDVREPFTAKYGNFDLSDERMWGTFGKIVEHKEVRKQIQWLSYVKSERSKRNAGTVSLYVKVDPRAEPPKKKRLWVALDANGTGIVSLDESVVRDYIAQAPPGEQLAIGTVLVSEGFCAVPKPVCARKPPTVNGFHPSKISPP